MPWVTFFAGREDLLALLRFVYAETDCRVIEVYSVPDQKPREFPNIDSIAALSEIGAFPNGPHVALWSPAVGAPPVIQRIDLRPGAIQNRTHRFVMESCGLITLQCGGVGSGLLTASRLGWWTEASAARKANPSLGANIFGATIRGQASTTRRCG